MAYSSAAPNNDSDKVLPAANNNCSCSSILLDTLYNALSPTHKRIAISANL